MTELTENRVQHDTVRPEESMMAALNDQTSLAEVFNNALGISQDVAVTGCEDSGEADSREEPEEGNVQHDGQKASSAGDPTDAESKWAVGDECRAVWSVDGKEYPATVVSMDGKQCRVCFTGYGNEEDMEVSALKSPNAAPQMQNSHAQDWKPGSRCRAVYSEDGLLYPAVVLWVNGQRCRIRFDDYNNEEEQDVNCLLNPDELYGPSRVTTAKVRNWRSSAASRQRGEETPGAERSPAGNDENHTRAEERPGYQSNTGEEADERKGRRQTAGAEKPANHSVPLFPPFPPPPPQWGIGDPLSFLSPPVPPVWTFGGKESDGSPGCETMPSMLMLWYMCGFHTGSFMAQQMFKSTSKDRSENPH